MEVRVVLPLLLCYVMLMGSLNTVSAYLFGGMMGNPGNKQTGNGSACTTNTMSCLPWCTRTTDTKGCISCNCNGGLNPMSGMNPLSGMNPMTGFNPMANMYSGLTGGQSPMAGNGGPRQGITCGTVPRTCPFPQPWCQRVADNNGCVKCLCGNDLAEFMQKFTGQSQTSNSTTQTTTSAVTRTTPMTTATSSATVSGPSSGMSCLTNFYCAKMCDNGYRTDKNNCPVCDCVDGDLIDTPVDATDPPGKHVMKTTTAHQPIVTNHVISCPGLFDCSLTCTNGYKSDSLNCPVCECMKV